MKRLLIVAGLLLLTVGQVRAQTNLPQNWSNNTASTTSSVPLLGPNGAALPTVLTSGQVWLSQCTPVPFARAFTFAAALQKVGTISVQRYIDLDCTLPVGTGLSTDPSNVVTLATGAACPPTSTYCGSTGENDGLPFLALIATLTEKSSSSNNVVGLSFVVGAE
jgi:hypothetical protein